MPAPSLSPALTKKAQALALLAHNALKCRHISRVDMILDKRSQKFYVLEVNTAPAMTGETLNKYSQAVVEMANNRRRIYGV